MSEDFIGFVPMLDTTELRLTDVLKQLMECKYSQKIWGQGYDNGSNMKGKCIGIQKRILGIDSTALMFHVISIP